MHVSLKIAALISIYFFCSQSFADTRANIIPSNNPTPQLPPVPNYPTILPAPPQQTPPQTPMTTQVPTGAPQAQTNPGNALSDSDITTNIQAKIMGDSTLMGANIKVKTANGVVTLEGTANTKAQADDAVKSAQSVSGVKNVQSNITVQAPANSTNPSLGH